jgi:hypothetical protein
MQAPIPYITLNSLFTFFDQQGNTFGTLRADTVEGRAFQMPIKGASVPAFRFAGFGPFQEGGGQFSGAQGMLTVNSIGSFGGFVISTLYVFRFYDPDGKFRDAVRNAWS